MIFIDAFQILPKHDSASHCHHQGVTVTSEATQAISVLWMYVDYSLISMASCRGMHPTGCKDKHTKKLIANLEKIANWPKR
jgi:hypothetical protein